MKNLREHTFLVLFIVAFILFSPVIYGEMFKGISIPSALPKTESEAGDTPSLSFENSDSSSENALESSLPLSSSEDVSSENTSSEDSSFETPDSSEETQNEPSKTHGGYSLFIGDSRTLGLSEYSGLENCVFFADSGMSVYNISSASVSGKKLQEVLSEYNYSGIYIMLGINELGYNFESSKSRYSELIDSLREYNPNAEIYIEANLLVTAEYSEKNEIFNNENIKAFNLAAKEIAEEKGVNYIDVNPLFSDGAGNLDKKYTFDGVHILGIYYKTWGEWIKETTFS